MAIPRMPPRPVSVAASMRNWVMMSIFQADALWILILVLPVTLTSMMFITPMPLIKRPTLEIPPSARKRRR